MHKRIKTLELGISHIEEHLLNLAALVRFGLYQIENSEPVEFMALKDQWCTMMYMIEEQVKAATEISGDVEIMERAQRQTAQGAMQ